MYVRLLHEMKIRKPKSLKSKKNFEHPIVQMDIHGVKTIVYSWLEYAKNYLPKKIAKD
jgi:hypothetical protein